jgi:hypothetical protein
MGYSCFNKESNRRSSSTHIFFFVLSGITAISHAESIEYAASLFSEPEPDLCSNDTSKAVNATRASVEAANALGCFLCNDSVDEGLRACIDR